MEYSPTKEILEGDSAARAVWECLRNNDPEGVMEMIEIYLDTLNKVKACEEAKIPRITMYKAFQRKNPTLKTLCKLVSCI